MHKLIGVLAAGGMLLAGCVMQTEPEADFSVRARLMAPSIVSVSTPGYSIPRGSSFSWHPPAINVYRDERLDAESMQFFIEQNIKQTLADIGMTFVASEENADYAVAYTAGLESELDDAEVLRRFGLMPGNARVPSGSAEYEKGTLVIYVLERGTGDIVWRSAMQAAVDFTLADEERRKRVSSIVKAMLGSLPVG